MVKRARWRILRAFPLSSSTSTRRLGSQLQAENPIFSRFRLSRGGRDARLARRLDEIGELSLENRPFNLVCVIALAIERRSDLREPRDATRPRQLKRAFDSGHLLIHAARLIRDSRRKRGRWSRDLTSFRKPLGTWPIQASSDAPIASAAIPWRLTPHSPRRGASNLCSSVVSLVRSVSAKRSAASMDSKLTTVSWSSMVTTTA